MSWCLEPVERKKLANPLELEILIFVELSSEGAVGRQFSEGFCGSGFCALLCGVNGQIRFCTKLSSHRFWEDNTTRDFESGRHFSASTKETPKGGPVSQKWTGVSKFLAAFHLI